MPRATIRVAGRAVRPVRLPTASPAAPSGTFAATHALGVGKLTMGQAIPKGQVPSGAALAFSGLPTQFDLKTTWDDGSARFAVLSANVASGGSYPLAVGSAAAGTFSPTVPTASVVLRMATVFPRALLGHVAIASGTCSVVLSNGTTDPSNTNYLMADSVLIVADSDDSQTLIRVNSPGYSRTSGWIHEEPGGLPGDDYILNVNGTATDTVTWTATGLAAGMYRVYSSWNPDPNRSSVSPFAVKDGTTVVASVLLDQKQAPTTYTPTGIDYTATLPGSVSSDPWLSGPLAREWRHVVVPVTGGSTPHPSLSVIFDVRMHADGTGRLDLAVENTYDVAGATAASYSADVTLDGSTVFSHADVTHYYLTRWRKVFPIGAYSPASVTPDLAPVFASKALPAYLSTVANPTYSASGSRFDILGLGGLTSNDMAMVGGRAEIAPYPDWIAQYLVHKGASQLDWMLRSGDLMGSQPIHIRKATGRIVSIDDQPQFWLDWRDSGYTDAPLGVLTGLGPFGPDVAHQPSVAYAPYLLTGDRYYMDEVKFWGNWDLVQTHPAYTRAGSAGVLANSQVRGFAWGLRGLVEAAAVTPDADPDRAYLVAKVANNLRWADDYVAGTASTSDWYHPVSALGSSFEQTSGLTELAGYVVTLSWQCNFLAWAITRANDLGFPGGLVLRDRMVAWASKKLNSAGDGWPRSDAMAFYDVMGVRDSAHPDTWIYYTTMSQVHSTNLTFPADSPAPSVYGIDARLSVMKAMELGLPGASAAYDYLTSVFSTPGSIQDGFAISNS